MNHFSSDSGTVLTIIAKTGRETSMLLKTVAKIVKKALRFDKESSRLTWPHSMEWLRVPSAVELPR